MADEVLVGPPPPVVAETEAEQKAKQEASLSPEELAQLDRERRENARKQAEAEEAKQNLTLEGLAGRLDDLISRVDALEAAASSSKSSTSSTKAASSDSGVAKSN